MGANKKFSIVGGLFFITVGILAHEDSLRSAVNAVNRRQRDLSDENVGDYGYSLNGPEDLLPFDLNPECEDENNQALDRTLLDYIDDGSYRDENDRKKRISSSFRERLEEDKERQIEELTQNFLNNLETENNQINKYDNNNIQYGNVNNNNNELAIRELWDKYRNYPQPAVYSQPKVYLNKNKAKKRMLTHYYTIKNNADNIEGLPHKRNNKQNAHNLIYLYNNYPPAATIKDDFINIHSRNNEDYYNNYHINNNGQKRNRNNNYYKPSSSNDYYSNYRPRMRRFPISKRSSNEYDNNNIISKITHEHKRSTTIKDDQIKTDPKVANELSNIFGNASKEKSAKTATGEKTVSTSTDTKEEFLGLINDNKPLQIKKKSVDWSDYFGLDRRKKINRDGQQIDNEWLMEQYQKSILAADKRNEEIPLQLFKDYAQTTSTTHATTTQNNVNKNEKSVNTKKNASPEELKINQMDSKLKHMEDTIIDDTIKYTGSHDSSSIIDSKEVQEVKDKIISRLAAAYSLEKMRRALGEYKLNVARQKEKLKHETPNHEDYEFLEEKRVSVPRKQAIDEDRENQPEGDNKIKCSDGDDNCLEQNYRTPVDFMKPSAIDQCPRLQEACSELASILGPHGRVFEAACNIHQMCLLCSNNSWFAPTKQCNALFLTKAFELCDGKEECQRQAQRSIRYLLAAHRAVRMEPLGDCELACPDK